MSLAALWDRLPARFGRAGLLDDFPVAASQAILAHLIPPGDVIEVEFVAQDACSIAAVRTRARAARGTGNRRLAATQGDVQCVSSRPRSGSTTSCASMCSTACASISATATSRTSGRRATRRSCASTPTAIRRRARINRRPWRARTGRNLASVGTSLHARSGHDLSVNLS